MSPAALSRLERGAPAAHVVSFEAPAGARWRGRTTIATSDVAIASGIAVGQQIEPALHASDRRGRRQRHPCTARGRRYRSWPPENGRPLKFSTNQCGRGSEPVMVVSGGWSLRDGRHRVLHAGSGEPRRMGAVYSAAGRRQLQRAQPLSSGRVVGVSVAGRAHVAGKAGASEVTTARDELGIGKPIELLVQGGCSLVVVDARSGTKSQSARASAGTCRAWE